MAADATAARIMNRDVKKMKQLTMGYAMGLGQIDEGAIDVIDEKLDRLAMKWEPAQLKVRPPG